LHRFGLSLLDFDGSQLTVSTGATIAATPSSGSTTALKEADECTATGHRVLDFVGGVMSPEMQAPKMIWLKRNFAAKLSACRLYVRPRGFPDLQGVRLARPLANAR
jgi:hypothetical protein